MLKLTNITLSSRLSDITVSADSGTLIHVIGPNGAGKSSLLAAIAGLLPYQGIVELQQQNIHHYSAVKLAGMRAYLSQQQDNRAMMQVFQYIALHQPKVATAAQAETVVMFLAEQLELTDKLNRPLSQLSGGEWQRVRLAAVFLQVWPALNPEARLLLLDEPMNSLDVAQQAALDNLLAQFCQQGASAIVSAHNLNHTLHHADEAWLLYQGKLIASGTTDKVMSVQQLENVFHIGFELFQIDEQRWLRAINQSF
ncbi:vitamin B12 ABC transporter ATP-binding protein BtuD [Budviciaceae bacterium BWR-B9]|uniref:Vitamin B12 import ATP-binding protein BtuD n=1 Tax=Limnobaculum allomyrinae TaxID=2791986 RepID=A0ABS1IKI7_9GAMM|nr:MULTISPECIES: vitamin B12 ABC transporter ATP-binding protein BtuD [Limnobaculum]MBK5142189.1 vitamin B12 ABC transporter ATP-binding protein BtuD [Limnobaculum allomyrinae]MBV7690927.1 vitamin B12 ABC transporter ATP-binding protein BtuD [Limnobaculum sp. M2-1]